MFFFRNDKITTVQIKQERFTFIHNTTRVLLFTIQKCSVDKLLPDVATCVVSSCWSILLDDEIAFDTKKNCGLIVIYTFQFLPSDITKDFVSKRKQNNCKR